MHKTDCRLLKEADPVESAVISLLLEKGFIAPTEVSRITLERLSRLMERTQNRFADLPDEVPEKMRRKVRTVLGLHPEDESMIDTSKRKMEIEDITQEMRRYLQEFHAQHPEVVGLILHGGRMNPEELASLESDMDVILILEPVPSNHQEERTGNVLPSQLQSYIDTHRTDSGIEVMQNGFLHSNELLQELDADPDPDVSILRWVLNPEAVQYIGNSVDGMDEQKVQEHILQSLSSQKTLRLRNEIVGRAKRVIAGQLGISV